MQCNIKNLSVIAYANGFTLWHYRSEHPFSSFENTTYFQAAIDVLRCGDIIFASSLHEQPHVYTGLLHVSLRSEIDIQVTNFFVMPAEQKISND